MALVCVLTVNFFFSFRYGALPWNLLAANIRLLSRRIRKIVSMWLSVGLSERLRTLILKMQRPLRFQRMKVSIHHFKPLRGLYFAFRCTMPITLLLSSSIFAFYWIIFFGIEKGKLADPFYRLEHQEEDLQKKKEAEPVLVRLQRVSDARHSDDYAINKALRAQLRVTSWFLLIKKDIYFNLVYQSFLTLLFLFPILRIRRKELLTKRGLRKKWG